MTIPLRIEPITDEADQARIADELSGPELSNYRGVVELKHRIEAAWMARGRRITIHVVGEKIADGMGVVFGLESDAINGLPPEAHR